MRILVGAPGNGTLLKDEIKRRLESDPRVDLVMDISTPGVTYPALAFHAGTAIVEGRADRAVLICGTGVGTAIAANRIPGVRAATAHDIVTVRGAIENYDAQILCMGQNVIAAPAAAALIDLWLDLRHDPAGSYHPMLDEIAAHDARATHA